MRSAPRLRLPRLISIITGVTVAALVVGFMNLHGEGARAALVAQATCPTTTSAGTPTAGPQQVVISFTNACGNPVPLVVTIAATPDQWQQGLMGVTNLPPNQGELFDFRGLSGGSEINIGFWMEDTPIPLSIAFIGRDNVVHEVQDMQAETTNIHLPNAPYLYAVEANLGWFQQNQIVGGGSVDLSAAMAQAQATPTPNP